ncbi:MAG: DmsE family decaheme c-type cytochrome [Xanthobacteraceae bacterium]
MLAVGFFVLGVLSGFSASARADDAQGRGDPIAELRNYVQSVATAQPQTIKVAEAGNLMEWLQQGAPPPEGAQAPKPAPAVAGKKRQAPEVAATTVGSKVCFGCHASVDEPFYYTLMGRLAKQGKLECESCHGPGSAHVKAGGGRGVGGIISFRKDDLSRTAEENNAICLGCHDKGERVYWPGSVHEERGLMCTNCHTIMKAVSRKYQLKTAFQPDTCFQCHKDRRAQMFESSHMPMREGKVVCSDCHNPHGSPDESLLRTSSVSSVNDLCYKCHAEKRGPFLFEHEPVRENCLNCHDPHGSMNQFSLKMQRPRLCTECHSLMHSTQGNLSGGTSLANGAACMNCHVQIHGSNSPNGAFFFR